MVLHPAEGGSEIDQGIHILRIPVEDPSKRGQSTGAVPGAPQGDAETVQREGVIRIPVEGSSIRDLRPREVSLPGEGVAEASEGVRVSRVQGEGGRELPVGTLVVPEQIT
jgi:hypothetical protein